MADGTLKVGTITTSSGSGNITIGSGVTINVNRPAFEAPASASQSLTVNVDTKINFPTERFDTDGCYDNSTNYRFTPTEAGKYFVYSLVDLGSDTNDNLLHAIGSIFKNGTAFQGAEFIAHANNATGISIPLSAVVELNGSTDYVEIYARINASTGTASTRFISSMARKSVFGAYKIGA